MAAVVNGTEITIAELNHEARLRSLPIASDAGLRDALLAELVQRELLVQSAVKAGLDRNPQFLLDERRSRSILLAQLLIATVAARSPPPSAKDVARFVAKHPAFSQRSLITVERILVPRTLDATRLSEKMAKFGVSGIGGDRSTETWDSASLPEPQAVQLLDKKVGDSFLIQGPNQTIVGKILSVKRASPSPSEQVMLVRERMAQEKNVKTLNQLLAQQRSAVIRYKPELAPNSHPTR